MAKIKSKRARRMPKKLPKMGLGGDIFSGALSGASAGSMFGPVGTAIGGGIGIAGAIVGGNKQKRAEDAAKEAQRKAQRTDLAFAQYEPTGGNYMSMKNGGKTSKKKASNIITPSKPVTTGGTRKKRFPSEAAALAYYKSVGAGDAISYSGADKKVHSADRYDPTKIITKQSSDLDFERTRRYQQNRLVPDELDYNTLSKGGRVKMPNGGTASSSDTRRSYVKNIKGVENYLNKNIFADKGIDNDIKRSIGYGTKNLFKEVPSGMQDILDPANQNEMKYINNLYDRMEPHMTAENAATLGKKNNVWNIPAKVGLVRDLPLYEADADSLQKYAPQFYEDMNMGAAKPFLKDEPIPEYAMGGNVGGVPVEVEGGESAMLPNGQDVEFEGPSHANGGIPTELPEGTEVLSDKLKPEWSKKTYSDINKKIIKDTEKNQSILEDPFVNSIDKKTAKLNLRSNENIQKGLFMDQEMSKMKKTPQVGSNKMEDGGEVTRGKIANMINASIDNLYDRYEKTGYNTADGKNTNYKEMLEAKRSRMLGRLDEVDTPERLNNLFSVLSKSQGMLNKSAVNNDYSGLGPLKDLANPEVDNGTFEFESAFDEAAGYNFEPQSQLPYEDEMSANMADMPMEMEPWMTDTSQFIPQGDTSHIQDITSYLPTPRTQGAEMQRANQLPGTIPTEQLQANLVEPEGPKFADSSTFAGDALRGIQGVGQRVMGAVGGLDGLAKMAPALYNVGQGLFGKADTLNPADYQNSAGMAAAARMRNRRFNVDPMLDANRQAQSIGNRNQASAARTRGELMGGLAAGSAQRGQADASVYAQAQNMNNQYMGQGDQLAAQVGGQNASMRRDVADYNARAQASKQNMFTTGLSQFSGIAQNKQRNQALAGADEFRKNLFNHMFPNAAKINS